MQKTENISIGKKPFICDLDAYKVIREYLDRAENNLKSDPDKDDIIADIEISMAKHFEEVAKGLVIDKVSAQKVLDLMGEVVSLDDNIGEEDSGSDTGSPQNQDKFEKFFKTELYKDHDRGILLGVCAGIARSIQINPFWIRAAFVLLALPTYGVGSIVVYVISGLIMRDSPTSVLTADEIIENVKEKSRGVSNWATQLELLLQRAVRLSAKVVVLFVRLALLATLIILGSVWSVVLFFMITNPSKVVLFGDNPAMVDFVAVLSVGLVILVPLFVLITQLAGSKMARNVRFAIAVWCVWTLSLLIGVGSLANAVPDIRERLVRDQPQTRSIFAEVQDGKLMHSCITLWGDCRSNKPNIYASTVCQRSIMMIDMTGEELTNMQNWSWSYELLPLSYPMSEKTYCDYIQTVLDRNDAKRVVFTSQSWSDEKYVQTRDSLNGATCPIEPYTQKNSNSYPDMNNNYVVAYNDIVTTQSGTEECALDEDSQSVWMASYFIR